MQIETGKSRACDSGIGDGVNIPTDQEGRYSNFFKVGYNAFEVVIEFGQAYGDCGDEKIHTRIVTTVPYANALCELLRSTLEEHAGNYGPHPTREIKEES
jgi:hypothetical protein